MAVNVNKRKVPLKKLHHDVSLILEGGQVSWLICLFKSSLWLVPLFLLIFALYYGYKSVFFPEIMLSSFMFVFSHLVMRETAVGLKRFILFRNPPLSRHISPSLRLFNFTGYQLWPCDLFGVLFNWWIYFVHLITLFGYYRKMRDKLNNVPGPLVR